MDAVRLQILGAPRTKKTSNRITGYGQRCRVCKRPAFNRVLPSEAFEAYEAQALPQLRAAWTDHRAGVVIDCKACDARGFTVSNGKHLSCDVCDGKGARPAPLDVPVFVAAAFYRDALRGDLIGYQQALADILEASGVVANDSLIVHWPLPPDGRLPLRKDAERARVEVWITPAPLDQTVQASLL